MFAYFLAYKQGTKNIELIANNLFFRQYISLNECNVYNSIIYKIN